MFANIDKTSHDSCDIMSIFIFLKTLILLRKFKEVPWISNEFLVVKWCPLHICISYTFACLSSQNVLCNLEERIIEIKHCRLTSPVLSPGEITYSWSNDQNKTMKNVG
jgi:hypothetical protein